MFSTESRRGRRILARLDRGADLFDQLRALCLTHAVRSGELRGTGSLELAELDAFDQAERRWKPPRQLSGGGLELLHLAGSVSEDSGRTSISARVTLMRDRDAGVEILGGHLRRAVVHSVELVIESFDDVLLRRAQEPATGLSPWSDAVTEREAPAPAASPPPAPSPPAPSPTWAEVAAVSREVAPPPAPPRPPLRATATATAAPVRGPEPPEPEEVVVNAGDVVIHPTFGRCVVHRAEPNGEFVQVALRNGRVVRLSLDILRLRPQGVENGQRIFSATVLT
jgi:predicted DNA-binding protein with PD1-like motif